MTSHRPQSLHLVPVRGMPALGDTREFHVSAASRDHYGFDESLFAVTGNVVFADFQAVREFAQAMNRRRDLVHHPERAVRAGDLNAMGLIDEIMHHLVAAYLETTGPRLFSEALDYLEREHGEAAVEELLERFLAEFPPRSVRAGEKTARQFLDGEVEGRSGREVAAEELLMLWVENENPAFDPFEELFDDTPLEQQTAYEQVIEGFQSFFASQPVFGPEGVNLIELLRAPMRAHPDSLEAQLAYIRERWGGFIGGYLMRLLRGMDLIREEHKAVFAGPGPQRPYEFGAEEETERFSPDQDWMPNVVLLAKSTLVWLDQLSRFYGREIRRLDQIPDEELDRISQRGFNSLWLIGIWRRSWASKQIKRMCGNPEAEASAYSLLEYEISEDLGGWPALENLRQRCLQRGILLASDMVPNHTAIDSTWVYDNPDRFVQLDHSPFPGYSFNGVNLSQRPGIGIYLEDHYYDRSDAAVVFKRVDFANGDVRYIYHGNDGTSMPWNDTAQLDFLNPETREAVIQAILHVARNFRVIRFDAAMILAKRHYQRLWYPEPGSGGDIASRAEHGLTAEEFNTAMPVEFWREVVDRCAKEAPNTLLLAEAFWMMEGYFVRTLGMHRVYNSAFMNMLKDEENAKYRQTIKNTIEFDKEILKRFVNFMNNPDEETAVAQFGTGDKYFGIATLMVTMPGLPMFGHGQIEGFAEKYGMEYSRAYWDESPDEELVRRHEREIFPLIRRRWAFSGVENFLLFDLYADDGRVNEDVYVYTNRVGEERTMVIFNNAFERAWGWVRESAGYVEKTPDGGKEFRRGTLADAFGLTDDHRRFCLLYEQRSGLWYIRNSHDLHEQGMYVGIDGFQNQVFLDIHEVLDNEFGHYARLADSLRGAGVPDIGRALAETALAPLHQAFAQVANSRVLGDLAVELAGKTPAEPLDETTLAEHYRAFAATAAEYAGAEAAAAAPAATPAAGAGDARAATAAEVFARAMTALRSAPALREAAPSAEKKRYRSAVSFLLEGLTRSQTGLGTAFALALCRPIGHVLPEPRPAGGTAGAETAFWRERVAATVDEWMLLDRLEPVLPFGGPESQYRDEWKRRTRVLLAHGGWYESGAAANGGRARGGAAKAGAPKSGAAKSGTPKPRDVMETVLSDVDAASYLGVNRHQEVVWFNKERFDILSFWLFAEAVLEVLEAGGPAPGAETAKRVLELYRYYEAWSSAAAASGYRVEALLEALA
jgi:glycosidase